MSMLEIPDLHGGLVTVKDWHGNVHENEWVLVISQTHIASTSPHYPSCNPLLHCRPKVDIRLASKHLQSHI